MLGVYTLVAIDENLLALVGHLPEEASIPCCCSILTDSGAPDGIIPQATLAADAIARSSIFSLRSNITRETLHE